MLQLAQPRRLLRVVSDQRCTPTHVPDVAEAIAFLLTTRDYGIYHVTNAGATNWHEFAGEIFRLSQLDVDVQAITTAEFGSPAARPAYSVLENEKYRQLGGPSLRPWREALAQYLLEERPRLAAS
jgi:dTDP-4-dehydrorhamnose reductase